ncbi:hypothetical protein ACGFKZ_26560 [Micromonospora tulbaghiae]|uniref:Secreted protein n=1 Tax=Micromonospora echinospora TaxID=1877 RepID=A0ABR6MEK2_MICEC|nr:MULTISPECIES: hypothetical protein [Micromonospora]MBB5113075.1 hypothetical protein [Micromonospora echinospora]
MNSAKRTFRYLAAIGAAGLVTMWASPAQAHEMTAYQGLDKAWISADHKSVTVQDKECDGNRVFVVVNLVGGGSAGINDEDGCSGNTGYGSFSKAIASFYVCENTEGCGTTVRVQ